MANKKNLVFLYADGFGLSSSWTGNAFMSATPKNFLNLWNSNPHVLINSGFNIGSGKENPEVDFIRVMTGQKVLSNKKFLDQYILEGELENNERLKEIMKEASTRNAAVHLIGNLPSKNEAYSSFLYLEKLLEIVHKKKIFQIYIHLVLGEDLTDVDQAVTSLLEYQAIIEKFPGVETASLTGSDFLNNSNIYKSKALEAITFGRGIPALTLEQALLRDKGSPLNKKVPSSIIYRENFTFRIKNFDTVISFNHDSKPTANFFELLSKEMTGPMELPKFLQIGLFFSPLSQKNVKIIELIRRSFENNLLRIISDRYELNIFSSQSGLKSLGLLSTNFSDKADIIEPEDIILSDEFTKKIEKISKKTDQFILIYLDSLSDIAKTGNFNQTEKVIKDIDQFIGKLIILREENNFYLVIFSGKGEAERLGNRNALEKMNNKTIAPLPFLLVEKELKSDSSPNKIFYDIIKNRESFENVAPSILELAGISSDQYKGKSFISKIRE